MFRKLRGEPEGPAAETAPEADTPPRPAPHPMHHHQMTQTEVPPA